MVTNIKIITCGLWREQEDWDRNNSNGHSLESNAMCLSQVGPSSQRKQGTPSLLDVVDKNDAGYNARESTSRRKIQTLSDDGKERASRVLNDSMDLLSTLLPSFEEDTVQYYAIIAQGFSTILRKFGKNEATHWVSVKSHSLQTFPARPQTHWPHTCRRRCRPRPPNGKKLRTRLDEQWENQCAEIARPAPIRPDRKGTPQGTQPIFQASLGATLIPWSN